MDYRGGKKVVVAMQSLKNDLLRRKCIVEGTYVDYYVLEKCGEEEHSLGKSRRKKRLKLGFCVYI